MKKRVKSTGLIILMFMLVLLAAQGATGFYVDNGQLYDVYGNPFIMRGVSHAHTWYTSHTDAIEEIKSVGANTVRVVLSSGNHGEGWIKNDAADVQNIINLCKANKLIALLECHDTTGYGEKAGAVSLDVAVDYWISIKNVLDGQEDYVLINIGNEPYGNINAENWIQDTRNAITAMRNAGFDHTLVVDAPNWGQDWEGIMKNNAQLIYDTDPTGNLVLSIHMYGVYEEDATINNYISTIRSQNLPLIIGEFGWDHSDGNPDEDAIMYRAVEYNIGYIAWSWCGNGGGVEYLDLINNWDVNNLSSWGDRLINGANGLKQTSYECSVFNGGGPVPTAAPPAPTSPPPSAGSCANVPIWNPGETYSQGGTRVQYNGMVYENRWYSLGQNPEEYSGANQVWIFIGMCDEGVPTPTPVSSTPAPVGILGDVNNDCQLTIVDALMVAQFYVGLQPQGFVEANADVNCDSMITIVDALQIAQRYVGLLPDLSC